MEQNLQHIINGCKQYNANMQEALYKHCYPTMLGVCIRYTNARVDAAALYNIAMLKVFTAIISYTNTGEFMGWVRRIVVNTCIDECRKHTHYKQIPLENYVVETAAINSEIETKISTEVVIAMLQNLPKNTALVFNLYAIDGYKFDEIASLLNITAGTAKWHVSEARKKLKVALLHLTPQKTKSHVSSY